VYRRSCRRCFNSGESDFTARLREMQTSIVAIRDVGRNMPSKVDSGRNGTNRQPRWCTVNGRRVTGEFSAREDRMNTWVDTTGWRKASVRSTPSTA
jgi:hypothetical protein